MIKKPKTKNQKPKIEKLKIFIFSFWFLIFNFWALVFYCYAKPVSSTELIEKAKEYNNQIVEFEGEAVGDVMVRGGFAWVNVNDGRNAVGIWAQRDQIQQLVNSKGLYKCKGDIVRIKGVFHRACAQHGGDLDIHMSNGARVKDGFLIPRPLSSTKIKWASGFAVIAFGLAVLAAIRSRKK